MDALLCEMARAGGVRGKLYIRLQYIHMAKHLSLRLVIWFAWSDIALRRCSKRAPSNEIYERSLYEYISFDGL